MKKSIIIGIIVGIGLLAIGFGTAISSLDYTALIGGENEKNPQIFESETDDSVTIKLTENMDFDSP